MRAIVRQMVVALVVVACVLAFLGPRAEAGMVYWTDIGTDKIQRAELDGSNVEDLVTTGLLRPRQLALDLAGGKMYWVDGEADKVQRAELDGSNVEDLVTGLNAPAGLALDVAAGEMYWTEYGGKRIQRADLDGTSATTVLDADDGVDRPCHIDLDLTDGKMYWVDQHNIVADDDDALWRADLDGTNAETIVNDAGSGIWGVALDPVAGNVYWTAWGAGKIRRADLDGSDVEDLLSSQSYPVGIALDVAGGKMYWADAMDSAIRRADLDGNNVEDLVTGLVNPGGVALDLRSLALIPEPAELGLIGLALLGLRRRRT